MKRKTRMPNRGSISKYLFILVFLGCTWAYGVLSHRYAWFPYPLVQFAITQTTIVVEQIRGGVNAYAYRTPDDGTAFVKTYRPDAVSPGLIIAYGIGAERLMSVMIFDTGGEIIHAWDVDVFDLWPDMDHVPENRRPKSQPGGEIAGLVLLPNGDIVFNFEPAGMTRLSMCGDVVWRLPYMTHHSVHLDESGNFFASGYIIHQEFDPNWPRMVPEFIEDTLIEVSPDGQIVDEISILDLLKQNNLEGLLYSPAKEQFGVKISGALLHLNDVESFPDALPEGVFERGDLMISLRNLNTIIVFNQVTRRVKFVHTGAFIRQHDPDFISGNEISVFDNNTLVPSVLNRGERPKGIYSKIVSVDARDNSTKVRFEGSPAFPFFTDIMGKHQRLPNGNLLITESRWGRVFEVTPENELVWEFNNILSTGKYKDMVGFIYEGSKLPPSYDKAMFAALKSTCPTN